MTNFLEGDRQSFGGIEVASGKRTEFELRLREALIPGDSISH